MLPCRIGYCGHVPDSEYTNTFGSWPGVIRYHDCQAARTASTLTRSHLRLPTGRYPAQETLVSLRIMPPAMVFGLNINFKFKVFVPRGSGGQRADLQTSICSNSGVILLLVLLISFFSFTKFEVQVEPARLMGPLGPGPAGESRSFLAASDSDLSC
jgi:hypothetical protein